MVASLLPRSLSGAQIKVEVSWDAVVTALYSTWTWTDITSDVRIADGINLKHGRGDEAEFAQPASCTLVLENKTGKYSLGGQASNWPNVVKNTPVRVSVDPGTGTYTAIFIGYADSWQPSWDVGADDVTVTLTASGILRRLQQHKSPVLSSLRRRLSKETNVVGYWPLEEGKLSTSGLSALTGHPAMAGFGGFEFASNNDSFASTVQMPVLKLGGLVATVPTYTFVAATGIQFRALMAFPDNGTGMTNDGIILRLQLDQTSLTTIDIVYGTGGSLKIQAWQQVGTVYSLRHNATVAFAVDGRDVRFYLELKQNGANVDYRFGIQTPGAGGSVSASTIAGGAATLGHITNIMFGAHSNLDGIGIGHATLQNTITSIFDDAQELDAFKGEKTHVRYTRLMTENGIESTVSGDGTTWDQVTDKMTYQYPESLLSLLQQIQEVDRGVIYDGRSHGGLVFLGRRAIENSPADMTLDVAAGDLAGALTPVDDDQALLNKAVVSREDGATAVFEDVTGPLGTSAVGTYDSSLTIPVDSDSAAYLYAGWVVSLGTVEGYRYPAIEIDLAARPSLITPFLSLNSGDRLDLTNISTVATQHPKATVRLVVQGIEQTITPFTWRATITCTPYDVWASGRLANTDGSAATGGLTDLMRLDTAGSQLNAAAAVNATSLSVATTSGPLWTTAAADLPFDISVGGITVTVTAISGAASPQTFTVTGVTKALASALPVQLASPTVLGL